MTDEATFVPEEHMRRKRDAYWADLVGGTTGAYKTGQIQDLLRDWTLPSDSVIVDVGAGTSYLSKMLAEIGGQPDAKIVCVDYDEGIIEEMRKQETDPQVEWRVADARELGSWTEKVGVVSYFDVLHEVYSFVGRVEGGKEVRHDVGIAAVEEVLAASAQVLTPGGVVVITDDVIPESDGDITLKCRNDLVRRTLKERVEVEYGSRPLQITWQDEDTFTMPVRTFATLLTQYNKPKKGDETRWAVEQMEVHQYMKVSDYERVLGGHGLTVTTHTGTADVVTDEWNEDFELVDGLDAFPDKRVAVVATK